MNRQEFNNLKIGDKVVVARVVNPNSDQYKDDLNPYHYIGKQGSVEDAYSEGCNNEGIEVLFEGGTSWYFNIEDIDLITEKETNMQQTKTPHRHADIIKAWADGEEIEVRDRFGKWLDVTSDCPSWLADEYRIKPKFEKRYRYAFERGCWFVASNYYKDDSDFLMNSGYIGTVFEKIEASGKDFQIN